MLGFLPTRAYRPRTPGATTFLSPLSGTFNYGWDSFILGLVGALAFFAVPVSGQAQPSSATDDEDAGIPIDNRAVIENCSSCHTRDDTGRMTRLSFLRKTPEGWQASIRRMIALNDVGLDPPAAREIVRYLSNNHGLAPEELRPGNFEVERRMIDHEYEADDDTEETCTKCHSMGRVITQRRTKDEWGLLMATHLGLYPISETQALMYNGPPPGSPGAPEDTRHPMDKAVAHLSEAFPLETPDWTDWSATMCSLVFSPGWEVDSSGGTAGLCQPVERDLFDCYNGCFWPVQVPDHLNHAPDWTSKCATAQQDWRKLDLIFP